MSTRDGSLQEVLTTAFDYMTAGFHTSIPGVILTVYDDLGQQRVDVQPVINMVNEDGDENMPRSPILNVPYILPCSTSGGMTFPAKVGESVQLMFSMRGLEVWKRGDGKAAPPSDLRKFDKRDAVALPGLYPFGQSPNAPSKHILPHSPRDVVMFHNIGTPQEVEIRLTESGDVRIKSVSGTIYFDSPVIAEEGVIINKGATINEGATVNGLTKMNNGAQIAQSLNVADGVSIDGITFATHRHTGVEGGNDTSGGPVQ